MTTKKCPKCLITKPLSEYHTYQKYLRRTKSYETRPSSYCKDCSKENSRRHSRTKPRTFEQRHRLLQQQAQNKRSLEVSITLEEYSDLMEKAECHYCGLPVQWTGTYHSYNIDRKNNKEGYTAENCVPCCTVCNRIRGHHLGYREMMQLGPHLRDVYDLRISKDPSKYRS